MLQDHFEEFYEDIFDELTNIGGDLEQLRVCENLSDHLTGNVYAKFREEEDAEKALKALMVRGHTPHPLVRWRIPYPRQPLRVSASQPVSPSPPLPRTAIPPPGLGSRRHVLAAQAAGHR